MSDDKKDVTEDSEAEEKPSSEEEVSEEEESSEEEGSGKESTSEEESSEAEEADDGDSDDEDEGEAEAEASSDEDADADEEDADADEEDADADEEDADADEEDADADEEDDEDADDEDDEDADDEDADDEDEDADDEDADEDDEDADAEDSDPSDDDHHGHGHHDDGVLGIAAFFDHPDHLIYAASQAREANYERYDAFSPFPIHGMDDAMGLGRSWIPWVTFFAGATGFTTANFIQFGIMWYDWPMVFGGKPFAAWPSFVPVMFELTVLLAGVTTAVVMLYAAGCFRKPLIIDPEITNDRFVLYVSADDDGFRQGDVIEFMKGLNPMEIRTVRKEGES